MKLHGVRIFVDDLAAARTFYLETLGLPLNWDMPELGAFGAGLENAELVVEHADAARGELIGRFLGVSLEVDDIAVHHRALADKGVVFEGPPTRQPWGGRLAHFRDPAGNTLTLLG